MSRLRLSRDDEGVHLLLGFDELEAVEAYLLRAGVDVRRREDTTCVGSAFAMLRFGPAADAERIQALLDRRDP